MVLSPPRRVRRTARARVRRPMRRARKGEEGASRVGPSSSACCVRDAAATLIRGCGAQRAGAVPGTGSSLQRGLARPRARSRTGRPRSNGLGLGARRELESRRWSRRRRRRRAPAPPPAPAAPRKSVSAATVGRASSSSLAPAPPSGATSSSAQPYLSAQPCSQCASDKPTNKRAQAVAHTTQARLAGPEHGDVLNGFD